MSKNNMFVKIISLFVALTFSFCNVSFSAVESTEAPASAMEPKELTAEGIGVAIDSGTVKSRYQGKSDKIIVHIQDAHCNYEAQTNINKILDQLSKDYGVEMISVEGAEGIVDTAWFRAFPDAEIRKEVADYFMKKGEITGAEFFSINSDYEGTIFGAEDRDYYVKNLKAFTEVYPYKGVIENYFLNLRTISNRLKSVIYPPKLKELDGKIRAFDDKEIELSDYARYLDAGAKKYRIKLDDCPNFKKLVDTLDYEKKIDFDIVDQERSTYIDKLSEKLSKEKMAELVAQSIRFKKGQIKAVDFYSHLRELAKDYKIPIVQEYPNLFYYYIYTKLYDGIDNEGLFREIDLAVNRLKDKFFTDRVQRELDKNATMISLYVDLLNIEMTNEDYDIFKKYEKEFSLDNTVEFLKRLNDKYGLGYSIDGVPAQVSEKLPDMVDFYEVAMKRDDVLVTNTLKQMSREKKDICVMITGGFHTKGIKDILEEKDISYIVVTPKITKDVETPYIKVLTNQRTSLEDIITESAAMPGMPGKEKESGILSPILRAAYSIPLYISDDPKDRRTLERWSRAIGAVEGGRTVVEGAEETYQEAVEELEGRWLNKVRDEAKKEFGEEGVEDWNRFVRDDNRWLTLLRTFLGKFRPPYVEKALTDRSIDVIGDEFYDYRAKEAARLGIVLPKRPAPLRPWRALAKLPEPPLVPPYQQIPKLTEAVDSGRPVYYVPGPRLLSATEPVREGVPVDDALRFPGGDDLARGLLGDRAIGRLGPVFPEINIAAAAPAGEPPIEFSSRERILVVTEVDEDLEIPPRVIVGFNPDRVKAIRDRNPANYEEEIKTEYKGLLEDYRAKLLRLVEAFEGKDEFRPFLESKGDVLAAMKDLPIQDREITEAYREFETAREKLEDFHDRRPVKVGDKIVIPARTPHALGPGVVVIEPTMERPAERVLGGGTMYPLPRELPRPADMTRLVDQLAVHIFEPGIPGEEIERPPIQQEPLRERFEHEGLGSQLITFNQAGTLELPTGGVLHTLAVVGEGKATVAAGNVVYPIPRAASDAALPVIPASSESFKIVAAAGTKIFDRALTEPEEVVTYPVREKRTSAVPAAVESLEGVTYLSSGETMAVSDILTIAGETSIPPIVGQPEPRPITVVVQRGEISVKLQDAAEPVVIPAGQTRTFPEMAVIEMITATSPDAAVVKLDYEKTEAEKIVYGYIETLRKHFEEIEKKGPVTLVMPSEMFRGVGINNPGSAAWWQKMFRTYVNESITIIPYWSGKHPKVEEVGLDAATKMVEEQLAEQPEDATTILVATREKIRLAGDEHKKTMSKVRILAVPDVDEADALKDEAGQVAEGWFFARETIGTGLLLSLVTPDMVFFDDDPDSAASDLQRFMELLLKRDVSRGDLCGMMSFEEMSRALETWGKEGKELPAWFERIKDSFDNITAYLRFLIDRALLKMPIRPFNANKELLERQENMFKTIRAV